MVKINYSKVEEAFDRSVNQVVINGILESAAWVFLLGEETPKKTVDPAKMDAVIKQLFLNIQNRLKHLKEKNPSFFAELALTSEEEKKYLGTPEVLSREDWKRLKELKTRMDAHFQEKQENQESPENVQQIESQQKEHVHKRYNVKKGWVPL